MQLNYSLTALEIYVMQTQHPLRTTLKVTLAEVKLTTHRGCSLIINKTQADHVRYYTQIIRILRKIKKRKIRSYVAH